VEFFDRKMTPIIGPISAADYCLPAVMYGHLRSIREDLSLAELQVAEYSAASNPR